MSTIPGSGGFVMLWSTKSTFWRICAVVSTSHSFLYATVFVYLFSSFYLFPLSLSLLFLIRFLCLCFHLLPATQLTYIQLIRLFHLFESILKPLYVLKFGLNLPLNVILNIYHSTFRKCRSIWANKDLFQIGIDPCSNYRHEDLRLISLFTFP